MSLGIVLNLEDTLIKVSPIVIHTNSEIYQIGDLYVHLRPYVRDFFKYLFDSGFNVGIFSSGEKFKVDTIVDKSIGVRDKLSFVFSEDQCRLVNNNIVKDLRDVWERIPSFVPERTILIDNKNVIADKQKSNWLPIAPWDPLMDGTDKGLLDIMLVLEQIKPRLKNPEFDIRDLSKF